MEDLDPARAIDLEALAECLRWLRIRAGELSLRELERRTARARGFLPGTRIERTLLGKSAVNEMLRGVKFPTKARMLTFVEVCGIDLEADTRWADAWDRLAQHYRGRADRGEITQQEPGQREERLAGREPTDDTEARATSTADLGRGTGKESLPTYPEAIRLVLKSQANEFFDDFGEHDSRDDARRRVDQEADDITSQLRAFLAMRFGPKNVSLDFRDVRFPKGWIRTRLEEELLASGFESSVWCEVAVTVDWEELTLLRELRNNQALRYAKTKSLGLLYPGCSLNLDEFAEDLYGRRVRMERFGKRELTFGKLKEVGANMAVITPENAVEVQVLDREFKELDLSAVLALAFNFLRIGDHLKFQGEADGVQPNNADHWSHRGHSPIAAGTLAARRYTNRIR